MNLIQSALRRYARTILCKKGYPPGHFYSPIPNLSEVRANTSRLFNATTQIDEGIDLCRDSQAALIHELAQFYDDFDWPEKRTEGRRFYWGQTFFGRGDAAALYCMLRHLQPRRIVEVGSGFSSGLMLDVRDRFLGQDVHLTFIDPYPDRLSLMLSDADRRSCVIIIDQVQNVPADRFAELAEGDILFIDSSHVSKIGSDVNYLLFEVLPSLQAGVIVHFHDILWPFEYPRAWVMAGRAWNESYLVRAFLQYNARFEIMLFNSFIKSQLPELAATKMPSFLDGEPGSLWLRKRAHSIECG